MWCEECNLLAVSTYTHTVYNPQLDTSSGLFLWLLRKLGKSLSEEAVKSKKVGFIRAGYTMKQIKTPPKITPARHQTSQGRYLPM